MNALALVLQLVALACFFIGWMGWSLPKDKPLVWWVGGLFWLLLSFMLSGVWVSVHPIH